MLRNARLGLLAFLLVHSWYDVYCCQEKDCHQVFDEDIGLDAKGNYTWNGLSFPSRIARPSLDGHYHVCVVGGVPRCIYIPMFY